MYACIYFRLKPGVSKDIHLYYVRISYFIYRRNEILAQLININLYSVSFLVRL